MAIDLRPTKSNREISLVLEQNGYHRSPKSVEKLFERLGITKVGAMEAAGLTESEDPEEQSEYQKGPLINTWGDPMLVPKLDIEWGQGTSVVPVVFLPDIHAPFHDPYAVELACKIIELVKPVKVVYLGDNTDWVQLSKFDKDPKRIVNTQAEVDSFQQIDRDIMSAAGRDIRRYYILGNHEKRMYKYHCSNPEISEIRGMQLDNILGLTPKFTPIHNLQIIEDEINWRNRFIVKHGNLVRKWSGYAAKAELDTEHVNGVSGHTHRASQYNHTQRGKTFQWTELGCLCDLDPTYMRNPNWQQALGVGWFNGDGKNDFFNMQLIIFSKYQAIVNGQYVSVKT
jgi:UDP-2,3-diacylglucosamine pyrophosphatase LpxH